MKFGSTRGGQSGLSFEDVLYSGYASDGGMLLPETIPKIPSQTLKSWSGLSYVEIVKRIVPLFVEDEVPAKDLDGILEQAFTRFNHPDILPIKRLPNGLNILEMYHGVTWAFKDLALSCVDQLFNYFLSKRKKHLTVVTATSGDTGSAAIEAVRGSKWVDIIVLLPRGRTSRVQELQMTTVLEDNVHVYRVDGTSDDLDLVLKPKFCDPDFVKKHNLCSINSVNFTRIMVQIAHFVYAYLQMCPECDREVEIAIPTGGCGNVTSGILAVKMGLPVKFVCCVTSNDIVARAINKGDFSASDVTVSLAPAMDIQIAYNMERIWHLFSDGDEKLVDQMMTEFDQNMKTSVPDNLKNKISEVVSAHVVTDEGIKEAMKRCWEENDYLVCPHTATTLHYYYSKQGSDNKLRICLASASPLKFEEAVKAAGIAFSMPDKVTRLYSLPTRYQDMEVGENWGQIIREKIEQLTDRFQKQNKM